MARFEVTGPDGGKYEITAPDNATQEEILSFLNQSVSQPKAEPDSAMSRFAYGAAEPVTGAAQLLRHSLPDSVTGAIDSADQWLYKNTNGILGQEKNLDETIKQNEKNYKAPEGTDAARIFGNILTSILATKGMGAPATAGKAAAQGAGIGAGLGAAAPVVGEDYWNEKGAQIGSGAVLGGALGPIGYQAGRMISPRIDPAVMDLRARGVEPTVGQSLGGGFNKFEEKMQSVPIVGDMIASARAKARDQFNTAAINDALSPIGGTVRGTGNQAVDDAVSVVSKAYDDAKAIIPGFKLDGTAQSEIANLRNLVRNIPRDQYTRFNKFFRENVQKRMTNGAVDSTTYKIIDSDIGKIANNYKGTELHDALIELRRILQAQAGRESPEFANALKNADKAFANMEVIKNASTRSSVNGGHFTPGQLGMASRATDRSMRKKATATGNARMQKLAEDAQRVLGDKYPDSGTAGRIAAMVGTGAVGGAVAPGPLLGLLSGAALYTNAGQRMLNKLIVPRNAPLITDSVMKGTPKLAFPMISDF